MNRRRFEQFGRVLVAIAALAASGSALADRGWHGQGHGHGHFHGGSRVGVGVYLGPGFGYPVYPYYPYYYPYYYPGYYYWPPVVAVPSSPPQYIERGDEIQGNEGGVPVLPQPSYWYHCAKPEGYYPYVKACPDGWQTVPAQPPAN